MVRVGDSEFGHAHCLWHCLPSVFGRAQFAKRVTITATLRSPSAKDIGEVDILLPSTRGFDAGLAEGSEAAYTSAVEAARLRREPVRNSVVHNIGLRAATGIIEENPCR